MIPYWLLPLARKPKTKPVEPPRPIDPSPLAGCPLCHGRAYANHSDFRIHCMRCGVETFSCMTIDGAARVWNGWPRAQEGACAVPQPAVSDPELHHTHKHGAPPSPSSTNVDGLTTGRPRAASSPFDEACDASPSSIWSLEQRRAAELVAAAEEAVGIDAACAVMQQHAHLFNGPHRFRAVGRTTSEAPDAG
jgi:hypothetical protein